MYMPIIPAVIIAILAVLTLIFGVTIYQRYLQIPRSYAALLFVVSALGSIASGYFYGEQLESNHIQIHTERGTVLEIFAVLLPLTLFPLLAKLYLKWIGGQLTVAEKDPGMEGVRAWLRGGNLLFALVLSLCGWQLFGYSFWGVLALILMALLAYPLLNMASISFQPPTSTTKPNMLTNECDRVLKMLDDGKITAEESADLLNALGHTVQPQAAAPTVIGPARKIVLTGSLLLLVGFFIPWFSINPGTEINRVMGQMGDSMNGMTPQNSGFQMNMPAEFNLKMNSINVAAGDLKYGLGWWILLLGIAVAVLPYVAENLEAQSRRKATLIGLSIGAVLLVYLLTQNMRYVSLGIVLAMAGYALEFIGALKEQRAEN